MGSALLPFSHRLVGSGKTKQRTGCFVLPSSTNAHNFTSIAWNPIPHHRQGGCYLRNTGARHSLPGHSDLRDIGTACTGRFVSSPPGVPKITDGPLINYCRRASPFESYWAHCDPLTWGHSAVLWASWIVQPWLCIDSLGRLLHPR